ncbi:MAG: beta-lactamase family protein [Ruminococcus sp.]|nr:beta-lactamase family protein [Ruminococcus sp.]
MFELKKTVKKFIAAALALPMIIASPMRASANEAEEYLNDPNWNAFVEEKIQQDSTPGLAVAVAKGEELAFKSWGSADLESQTPVTEETVFGIGSCSKAFTALAIFLLQEEGKLKLSDSVSKHLPWWNVTWEGNSQDTRIWQLLEHCSGLSNTTMMKLEKDGENSTDFQAHIAENAKLVYKPGTKFHYCNIGYDVLADIVEQVSGMPFEDYVSQEILQPIGMTHSGYGIKPTTGYRWFFRKLRPYNSPENLSTYGDGGLRSTSGDMALWLEAQLGHLDLPEKLTKAIKASHETPEDYRIELGEGVTYYNGWNHYNGYIFHLGTNPEFSSFTIVDEEHDMGVFAVSNAWINTPDYAGNSLHQIMKGEGIDRGQLDVPDSMALVDLVSTIICIICAAFILLILVLMFTQKKRVAKDSTTYPGEKKKLIRRLVLLIPLLALVIFLPGLLFVAVGYGFASCYMIGVWMPYTLLIAAAALAALVSMLIISSIKRFIHAGAKK